MNSFLFAGIGSGARLSTCYRSRDQVVAAMMDHYLARRGEPDGWRDFQESMVRESRVVVRLHPQQANGLRLAEA